MLAAIGLAWKLGGVGGVFKLVPRWLWILIAVVLIGLAGVWWHSSQVKQAIAAAELRGETRILDAVARKAAKFKAQGDKIALGYRSEANEKTVALAAVADGVRVRGPGKASCPGIPIGSPGRYDGAAPEAGHAVVAVPDQQRTDLIVMPFAGAVSLVEAHDRLLIEAEAWRKNEKAQSELNVEQNK